MGTTTPIKNYRKFDTKLIVNYILIIFIGWLTIYSSTYEPGATFHPFTTSSAYGRQLMWMGLSGLLAIIVLLIDSKIIQTYAYVIYAFTMLFVFSVIFIGTEISGAKAWIKIGSFSIQPIEFAKFATCLALAKYFSSAKTDSQRKRIWINAFLFILIPAGISILQNETGSALVFSSFIILFYREGFPGWILLSGFAIIILFILTVLFNELYTSALVIIIFTIVCLLTRCKKKELLRNIGIAAAFIAFIFVVNFAYNHVLQSHQRQRIDTILGKNIDPQGADFNLNQSKIAIGSGGFFGKGYCNGTQTKLNFVPEQSTDFIFCGIGEEWGFVGSLVTISLFMYMIIRILILSDKQRNPFTRVYGYGVASILFFHLLVNIGMTIGLMPIIGIPLPLISYGGSSLWGFTILIFIFIRLNDN